MTRKTNTVEVLSLHQAILLVRKTYDHLFRLFPVAVEYKDGLARFGFTYLESCLHAFGDRTKKGNPLLRLREGSDGLRKWERDGRLISVRLSCSGLNPRPFSLFTTMLMAIPKVLPHSAIVACTMLGRLNGMPGLAIWSVKFGNAAQKSLPNVME